MSWQNEYPRPQLQRDSFLSLNGQWRLNEQPVFVPFPPQSGLSGWQGDVPPTLIYERSFRLPEGFCAPGMRVRLHFGAVDQIADVLLNGRPVAHHEGGYLPFQADVTDWLREGENLLSVVAEDVLDHDYPYGKQCKKPHGMWYTPVSGIWQSVWMEAVPACCIEGLTITPSLDSVRLTVDCPAKECVLTVDGLPARTIPCGQEVEILIPQPHRWTVEDPYLYHFTVQAGEDRVRSYFALRTVEIRPCGDRQRICLNGEPVFLNGVLDQGYFQDGIFLPEDPKEYERDVLRMKALGFNLLRKHIKVEPEAFYYACDRLGMLVMQDMVQNGGYSFLLDTALPTIGLTRRSDRLRGTKRQWEIFLQHSVDTVRHVYNHPCVIAYTIFNEGWGQQRADECCAALRKVDSTRIWDATSGWFHQKDSDVESLHVYFRNKQLVPRGERPLLLSECGGYTRTIPGHLFKPDAKYGYGAAETEEALTQKIAQMYEEMVLPAIGKGLCGVVYTQLSDVEEEINGLYTYDREVCKVDAQGLREVLERAQRQLVACCAKQ